jgi:hypothetical protein
MGVWRCGVSLRCGIRNKGLDQGQEPGQPGHAPGSRRNGLRKSPSHRPGLAVGARGSLGEGVRTLAVNLNCRKPNWFPCTGKKKAPSDDGAKSR